MPTGPTTGARHASQTVDPRTFIATTDAGSSLYGLVFASAADAGIIATGLAVATATDARMAATSFVDIAAPDTGVRSCCFVSGTTADGRLNANIMVAESRIPCDIVSTTQEGCVMAISCVTVYCACPTSTTNYAVVSIGSVVPSTTDAGGDSIGPLLFPPLILA